MLTCKSKLENFLSKIKTMDNDGTFEYCKKLFANYLPFTTFLTIYYYILLIYFLLKDKQTITVNYIY